MPWGPPQRADEMASTEEQTRPETRMSYADASTRRITADNAIDYAYRELGEAEVPLVPADVHAFLEETD